MQFVNLSSEKGAFDDANGRCHCPAERAERSGRTGGLMIQRSNNGNNRRSNTLKDEGEGEMVMATEDITIILAPAIGTFANCSLGVFRK